MSDILNPQFPNFLEVINDLFQEWKGKDYWDSITKVEIIARQQTMLEAMIIFGQEIAALKHQVKIIDTLTTANNNTIMELQELAGLVEEEELEPIKEDSGINLYA